MRITEYVDIPDALLEAQDNDTLVVFAGAGISIGPPSNLPSFKDLAKRIAEGSGQTLEENEPIDRFLGRLGKAGIQVHRKTRDIIRDPDSKPTDLHRHLVSLFRQERPLRIVTTNFDTHFSTVVAASQHASVPTYFAPALPLGDEVDGLVYLHGSVTQNPKRLVVTDSDFGKAYLLDGWATKFLLGLFEKFVVLFIGYSHQDPVMHYLARALPLDTKRFALTPAEKEQHWKFLGIGPVPYPISQHTNDHSALVEAVRQWADRTAMGAFDHSRRIREIVSSAPPLDPPTADYMQRAINSPETLQFFTRDAKSVEWLDWIKNKPVFARLFDPVCADDCQESGLLADWFAHNFVVDHPREALSVVMHHRQGLGYLLWLSIANALAFGRSKPSPEVLGMWVPLLLDSAPHSPVVLGDLLEQCRFPEDQTVAVMLFRHLTEPIPRLRGSLAFSDEPQNKEEFFWVDVDLAANHYYLDKSWKDYFKPHLAALWPSLLPILCDQLGRVSSFYRAYGRPDAQSDVLCSFRSAIEPQEQGQRLHKATDALIDATRDTLEWLLTNNTGFASCLIVQWLDSDVPILRRLGVHGLAESCAMNADEKITLTLKRGFLYRRHLEHEVFRLLAKSYPEASPQVRQALINQALEGPTGTRGNPLDQETRDDEAFRLFSLLRKHVPSCELLEDTYQRLQEKHPSFGEREYPDLHIVMRGFTCTEKYVHGALATPEELLGQPAAAWIDRLCEALAHEDRRYRQKTLANICETCRESFEWGADLLKGLSESGRWNPEIGMAVLEIWRSSRQNDEQWSKALNLLSAHGADPALARSIAYLLDAKMRHDSLAWEPDVLQKAEQLAFACFDVAAQMPAEGLPETTDWLTTAINHPAGVVTEFLLQSLSKRQKRGQDMTRVFPAEYKECFEKMLSGTSEAAQMGRVVLASRIGFLDWLDWQWCRANVVPLLDWSRDVQTAEQAWNGFLTWGQGLSLPCVELLFPHYIETLKHLDHVGEAPKASLCHHLAGLAVHFPTHPLERGWLTQFVMDADENLRIHWCEGVRQALENLDEDAVVHLWQTWLRQYWDQRASGAPVPLKDNENQAMIGWLPLLGPVLDEAVKMVCRIPPPRCETGRVFFHNLATGGLPQTHPAAVVTRIAHLLRNMQSPFYNGPQVVTALDNLPNQAAPQEKLTSICEALLRLGYLDETKLQELMHAKAAQ
jgi:hypothetical protein